MCGIAGITSEKVSKVNQILDTLSHRGPDRRSYFKNGGVTLFHTLLSTRGHSNDINQPVVSNCKRWAFVFNGEIYNTPDLINLMQDANLQGKSDTAVLAQLVENFGIRFADYIDGMFAIALFDNLEKKVYLMRDQSGQKNIFYNLTQGDLHFSSELSSLIEMSHCNGSIVNETGLRFSAHLGYWPGPETFINGVKRILPGQILEFDIGSKNIGFSYLKTNKYETNDRAENKFTNLIRSTFDTNCAVALNLSGGVDSSIILHELMESFSKVNTYTTIYSDCSDLANTEAQLSRKLSKDYGSSHTEFEISRQDYIDNFVDAYTSLDEPNYNVSIPIYHLLAKFQGINGLKERVLFSGDGGDEVFCGYDHYNKSHQIDNYLKFLAPKFFNELYSLNNRKNGYVNFSNPIERWVFFKYWKSSFLQRQVTRSDMVNKLSEDFQHVLSSLEGHSNGTMSTMFLDRHFWLAGENYTRVDKIFMSQSIEVRLPFATPRFVDHMEQGMQAHRSLKYFLNKKKMREKYTNKLPDYITKRMDKVGWRGPVSDWYSKEMKNLFCDIVPTKDSDLIRWSAVRNHIMNSKHWPGKQIHWYLSTALLAQKFGLDL